MQYSFQMKREGKKLHMILEAETHNGKQTVKTYTYDSGNQTFVCEDNQVTKEQFSTWIEYLRNVLLLHIDLPDFLGGNIKYLSTKLTEQLKPYYSLSYFTDEICQQLLSNSILHHVLAYTLENNCQYIILYTVYLDMETLRSASNLYSEVIYAGANHEGYHLFRVLNTSNQLLTRDDISVMRKYIKSYLANRHINLSDIKNKLAYTDFVCKGQTVGKGPQITHLGCGYTYKRDNYNYLKTQYGVCPCCGSHYHSLNKLSSGENFIRQYLFEQGYKFDMEHAFKDLDTAVGTSLRYDFYVGLPNNQRVLIEYNGIIHYTYIEQLFHNEQEYEKYINHYNLKKQYAKQNKIPLIEVPYTVPKHKLKEFVEYYLTSAISVPEPIIQLLNEGYVYGSWALTPYHIEREGDTLYLSDGTLNSQLSIQEYLNKNFN